MERWRDNAESRTCTATEDHGCHVNTDTGLKLARIAAAASVMALAESLPFNRPNRGEVPFNGAWQGGGKHNGRAFRKSDHRAFVKRVAKRRARKGYA